MDNLINVALTSFGMSGEIFHAPLIAAHPRFNLKKVLERNNRRSQQLYADVEVVKTLNEILADESVELVVVNTPNPYHFDMCSQALEAGKHVIVEKPFTNTAAEAKQLIELAKINNCLLTVFQNRRWDGDFLTVRKVINSNVLGELVEYEAHYDRYRNYVEADTWKEETGPGSGILFNLGSHMIDQVLVLFGMPERVTATLSTQRQGGKVQDNYHIMLTYEKLRVVLKSSYLVRELGPRYMLHGNEGSFIKYGIDPQEEALKAGKKPGSAGWGVEPESDWGKLNTSANGLHLVGKVESETGNYLGFYDNVYAAMREGKELCVKPEQAMQVIRIIEAAQESSQTGKSIRVG